MDQYQKSHCHFCHTFVVRSKSLSLAPHERRGGGISFLEGRSVIKDSQHILKPPHSQLLFFASKVKPPRFYQIPTRASPNCSWGKFPHCCSQLHLSDGWVCSLILSSTQSPHSLYSRPHCYRLNLPLQPTFYSSAMFSIYSFYLIGIYLLYNVVLVSAVQRSESAICIHISPPSWTSLPPPHIPPIQVITEHRAEIPVLYRRFPLAICFTHGSINMSILISQFNPLPSPTLCPHICSLHLHLYSCPAYRFICTIFLDSTYMH